MDKRYYKTGELVSMGLSKDFLMNLAHSKGQTFAFKPMQNGKYLWDLERLQKHLDRCLVR